MKHFYILCVALITSITLNAQTVDIPDTILKNRLVNENCVDSNGDGEGDTVVDTNSDGEIQVTEAQAVLNLNLECYSFSCRFSSAEGLEAFINLEVLNVRGSNLISFDVSTLTNLNDLDCGSNDITTLELGTLPSLLSLNCRANELSSIDVSGLTNLTSLNIDFNFFESIDVGALTNLTNLECRYNELSSLDVSALTNLTDLRFENNELSTIDLSTLTNLTYLDGSYNQLSSLDVSTLTNLTDLHCRENQISALDVSALTNLTFLECSYNLLTALDVSALINLTSLSCSNNQLTALDVSALTNLNGLTCGSNQLTGLDVSMLTDITWLWCDSNQITELDVSSLTNLNTFNCGDNLLTELDVTNNPLIHAFYCYENQLTFLDLSNKAVNTFEYAINDNLIETLILKNGNAYDVDPFDPDFAFDYFILSNNPLTYVCADEIELELVNNMLDNAGITNCAVNTYCSFVPGGDYFTIEGITKIDLDVDGCNMTDTNVSYLNFEITNGTETVNFISNGTGNYNIPVPEGSHTITPILESPDYFSVSPTSIVVNFPTDISPHIQDFCVTPNGVFNDLEISIISLELARPGFDVDYRVVYKNKGNTTLSGDINFSFQDDIMDFITSTPANESGVPDLLQWSFVDLTPFESREINLTMNLNAPTDTPPLNDGDILTFNTFVDSSETDETPDDNNFELTQTVVNSFDPNDKTCLEGDFITPEMVGEYVHYMIRFENTGSAEAVNIVVKDHIDITKYDLTSLVPLHASHDFFAKIKNTAPEHYVELIFENINLPFDDANNDGYIVFKIKTLDTLVLDDTIENEAEIYFDFNFPIITNTSEVTVATLSNEEFEFTNNVTFYPNPTNSTLHIESSKTLTSVEIYNLLGQQILTSSPNALTEEIDMSSFNSGVYLVKVEINNYSAVYRVIKE